MNGMKVARVENTGHENARNIAYGKPFLHKLIDSFTWATAKDG